MPHIDTPASIETQITSMKKYTTFRKRKRIKTFLEYAGYFRVSRYGKYLLSFSGVLGKKPDQNLLYEAYNFDIELRKILFNYCKKAEIHFKTNISNAVSLKETNPVFYLDDSYFTKSKGERDANKRKSHTKFYAKYKTNLDDSERALRSNVNKYPEFKEYRSGGTRASKKIPCWAAFSYFEFGTVSLIYSYLRADLKKEVLVYGYSLKKYNKTTTSDVDTWLDAIRNLRNTCAHYNKLIGKTSSVVLFSLKDSALGLSNNTDLFSRLYALKKILNKSEAEPLKNDLKRLIKKSKFDVYTFNVLPSNWETLFDQITYL